jgi:predicted nucleotidyltransferase
MKFGLSPQHFYYILTEVVKPLEKHGAEVWCYGSRARGDHQKFSDLDLMVESNKDLSKVIGELLEKVTKSNFPYKIDLVQITEFADSYKDGYLKDRKRFT